MLSRANVQAWSPYSGPVSKDLKWPPLLLIKLTMTHWFKLLFIPGCSQPFL